MNKSDLIILERSNINTRKRKVVLRDSYILDAELRVLQRVDKEAFQHRVKITRPSGVAIASPYVENINVVYKSTWPGAVLWESESKTWTIEGLQLEDINLTPISAKEQIYLGDKTLGRFLIKYYHDRVWIKSEDNVYVNDYRGNKRHYTPKNQALMVEPELPMENQLGDMSFS